MCLLYISSCMHMICFASENRCPDSGPGAQRGPVSPICTRICTFIAFLLYYRMKCVPRWGLWAHLCTNVSFYCMFASIPITLIMQMTNIALINIFVKPRGPLDNGRGAQRRHMSPVYTHTMVFLWHGRFFTNHFN